jgi:hypothetical protein
MNAMTRVRNHMNRRGSRSTLEERGRVGFTAMFAL